MIRVLLTLVLSLCVLSHTFADDVLLRNAQRGKTYSVTIGPDGSVSWGEITKTVDLGGTNPNPPDPPPPVDGISKVVEQWTKESIAAGGTPTTAAALSGVFGLVSKAVNDGTISVTSTDPTKPPPPLTRLSELMDAVTIFVNDGSKWQDWRGKISNALNESISRADLRTKEQWVVVLNDIKKGIDTATGFTFDPSTVSKRTAAQAKAEAADKGILDIDFEKLWQIIEFIIKLIELFKPI